MQSYLKFAKHIFIVGFIDFISIFQTLIFLPLITKILGTADYGTWSQLKVTMSLLTSFTFLGLHEALVRFLPGQKDARNVQEGVYSSLSLIFGINLIIALFLLTFYGPVSAFLKIGPIFVKLLALIIIFESLNTFFFVVVRVLRQIGSYFWFMVFKMFGETALVIGAISLGYGLYGSVISLLLIRIAVFSILFTYTLKKIGTKIPNFSLIKNYLHFSLPTIVDSISYWTITSVDRYFIGFFWGIVFVGYYAPAYSIGTLLTLFLFPIAFMLSVVLPKSFDENKIEEVKDYLSHSLKYFLSIAIPAAFGVSVLSKQLLLVFSNEEIANAAFFVIPIVASSIFLYGVTYFFSQILSLVKKTKLIAITWIIGAVLNIVLNIIFIPPFGIIAAALTTFASYLCTFLLMRYFAFKEFQFKIEWSFIIKSALSSLFMVLFIIYFNPQNFLNLILSIILGVFIYGFFVFMLRGFGRKEIIFFKNLIYEMVFSGK